LRKAAGYQRLATCDWQLVTGSWRLVTCNWQNAFRKEKIAIEDALNSKMTFPLSVFVFPAIEKRPIDVAQASSHLPVANSFFTTLPG